MTPALPPLIYSFTLTQVACFLGAFYIAAYGLALARPAAFRALLTTLPRNYPLGVALTALAGAWFLWLLATVDLMEYTPHRAKFLVLFGALAVATAFYLREFLTARAGGALALLFAKVMLDAAFLRDEPSRFVITVLAYIFVLKGMVLVSYPYYMRDAIQWCTATPARQKTLTLAGLALGALLLALGIFVY